MEKASGLCGFIRNLFGSAPAPESTPQASPDGSRDEIFEAVREAGRKAREASRRVFTRTRHATRARVAFFRNSITTSPRLRC